MAVVNIEDVAPGMTLAEAVRNHQDQLLLDAGRRITGRHIRVFKSWGVRRVAVASGSSETGETGGGAAAAPAAIDETLRARFADVLDDPLMEAILQAAGRQLALRSTEKKGAHGRG